MAAVDHHLPLKVVEDTEAPLHTPRHLAMAADHHLLTPQHQVTEAGLLQPTLLHQVTAVVVLHSTVAEAHHQTMVEVEEAMEVRWDSKFAK